jgi:hypothetical protein
MLSVFLKICLLNSARTSCLDNDYIKQNYIGPVVFGIDSHIFHHRNSLNNLHNLANMTIV